MIKLFRKDARNQRLKGIRLSTRERAHIEAACDEPIAYERGMSAADAIEVALMLICFCFMGWLLLGQPKDISALWG